MYIKIYIYIIIRFVIDYFWKYVKFLKLMKCEVKIIKIVSNKLDKSLCFVNFVWSKIK